MVKDSLLLLDLLISFEIHGPNEVPKIAIVTNTLRDQNFTGIMDVLNQISKRLEFHL